MRLTLNKIFKELRKILLNRKVLLTQMKELEWAHIFHDSIKGKEWLENLPLNIGRWAGNYSFFYVLHRTLENFKPKNIVEFGLGESTKFISSYLEHYLDSSNHVIIEHDQNWRNLFKTNFLLTARSKIIISPLCEIIIKGHKTKCYEEIDEIMNTKFDLYVIDGPFGGKRYSRYDIVNIANQFNSSDQFIIIYDDYNRSGEKDTIKDLLLLFKKKRINIFRAEYAGNKSVLVLATEKYKYATSF